MSPGEKADADAQAEAIVRALVAAEWGFDHDGLDEWHTRYFGGDASSARQEEA